MYTLIILGLILSGLIWCIVQGINSYDPIGFVIIGILLIFPLVLIPTIYSVELEVEKERYLGKVRAIEQTKEMLKKEGKQISEELKSVQLESRLVALIEKREDIKASLLWRQKSKWVFIKPNNFLKKYNIGE